MGLHAPEGSRPDVMFSQFATGYCVYGIDNDFNVLEDFDTDDASELRLWIDGGDKDDTTIAIKTQADYDRAVTALKGIGWTGEQITKVFNSLSVERDLLPEKDEDE